MLYIMCFHKCNCGTTVLYRIANHKRSMVAHNDSLKLCSDHDLPIWLLKKRHALRRNLGEDQYVLVVVVDQFSIDLKIVKTIITPYHPSANGQVQRMNRTILQIIRCFIQGQQEVWDQHLGTVGIRSTVYRQIGTRGLLVIWS